MDNQKALQELIKILPMTQGNGSADAILEDIRLLFGESPVDRLDYADKQGNTPLLHASRLGNNDALHALMGAQVSPNAQNKRGESPLIAVAKQGNAYGCLRLLKANADASLQDRDGKTALMHWLLNVVPPSHGQSAVYLAGRQLLSDGWGVPAPYLATSRLIRASRASVNVQDAAGKTALHHLAGSPVAQSAFGIALSAGLALMDADVDIPDKQGVNAVMQFAKIRPANLRFQPYNHIGVFARSRDINKQDSDKKTALIHAAENGNLSALIGIVMSKCPDLNLMDSDTLHALGGSAELPPLNPNIQDKDGENALMKLAKLNSKDFESPLWNKAFAVLFRNVARSNPTAQAMPYNELLANAVHLLSLAGTDALATNAQGESALMIAAKTGNLAVIQALSQNQEALRQTNHQGQTVLDLAYEYNQPEAAALLLKAGAIASNRELDPMRKQ